MPDLDVGRRATTIEMDEPQPRASYGCNRSNERWLQLGNGLSGDGRARSNLKRSAHLAKMRELTRDLRLVTDVQMAGELDPPCHEGNNGEHRRPMSQAAAMP